MPLTEQTATEMTCKECGKELEIGLWPFCNGTGEHGSVFREQAQRFDPIVLFQAPDGTYKFPGRSDDPCPAGHQKIEITTIQQADRITRDMNQREHVEMVEHQERERQHFDGLRKEHRERLLAEVRRRGLKGELTKAAMAYRDDQRRLSEAAKKGAPNMFFEVFAFDSSNRAPYSDERTDWKSRKV